MPQPVPPTGASGAAGAPGVAGASGVAGAAGASGVAGAAGATGAPGVAGASGAPDAAGAHDAQDGLGVPDIVAPGLAVLFCGINPGALSGATGRHFARPGNRFWKVLAGAGLTDRVLTPDEQWLLLDYGIGITNLVARTTASAAELTRAELVAGAAELEAKVAALRPERVAVLGVQAYRQAWGRRSATIGRQPEDLAGAALWVLPNPSGLQAHYQLPTMIAAYRELTYRELTSREPTYRKPTSARRPVEQLEPGAGDAAEFLLLDDERR